MIADMVTQRAKRVPFGYIYFCGCHHLGSSYADSLYLLYLWRGRGQIWVRVSISIQNLRTITGAHLIALVLVPRRRVVPLNVETFSIWSFKVEILYVNIFWFCLPPRRDVFFSHTNVGRDIFF